MPCALPLCAHGPLVRCLHRLTSVPQPHRGTDRPDGRSDGDRSLPEHGWGPPGMGPWR